MPSRALRPLPPLSPLPGAATPVASSAVFVGTFAVLVALIGGFLAFDLFLASVDRRESAAHAETEYRSGLALLAAGHARDAAERFGAAVAIDRTSPRYALARAQALLADGRTRDAVAMLQALLDHAENDGAANLAMAHAMLREGRDDEAASYFHRAIFGRWGADSLARRRVARFELIDLLERRGRAPELLAELLPLADTPLDSVALRERLGLLFVRAGSPARAVAMLRDVLRRAPDDAAAYAGLGEAALALGNFGTAHADFAEAVRLRPTDARLEDRLALADTVLATDPTARGIGVHARYVRGRALLERTVNAASACRGMDRAGLDSARAALVVPVRPADEDDAADTFVARASDLWSARPAGCPSGDESLAVLHARVRE